MALIPSIDQRLTLWATAKQLPMADLFSEPSNAALEEAIAHLPTDLRVTVTRVYVAGGTLEEQAHELGCPTWTINRRLGRAHQMIRESLLSQREKNMVHREVVEMRRRIDGSGV